MKKRTVVCCWSIVLILGLATPRVANAEWLFNWSSLEGGNDHWYKLVLPEPGEPYLDWGQALLVAENETLFGMKGYLATDTSAEEHAFLERSLVPLMRPVNYIAGDAIWIGLTDRVTEGEFRWITDESSNFRAWLDGEPNDSVGGASPDGEDGVCFHSTIQGSLGWNDVPIHTSAVPDPWVKWGYLVEFSPQVVPAPSSLITLTGVGLMVFGMELWKKRRRGGT